ncbi:lytic murein transglycosylase [Rhizobium laguerreae]|uniref:lytic murein transglycosylase n=1 Tax=Rhizobium laguerreae TaxID=1076926 RepID=UPI001479635D|nr:lytic murein transglycosylase [Rhizobium laguerreae]MBY3085323.1 lytic murein transglycosylase [Rhizobium laguerreae]MBY3122070.1 lytic murein transglycosylase [Rhizobium laguerreae]MBY3149609.1 lytic murein transglycosylase [Rhizobium laguerreae]MBY3189598.1 lytic murein transglycosylase [Rhizobium laguerreae]MBY3442346.1 lytic murein transglycosylase [Rhizobium laguerreae]
MPGRAEGGVPRRLRIFAFALTAALLPLSCYAAPSKADVEVQFEKWVQADLWPEAKANGISEKVFQAAFSGITLNWNLPDLAPPGFPPPKEQKQTQAEFSSPAPYFNEDQLKKLAATGRGFAAQYGSTLKRIEKTYGVPGSIVLAIWGRETGFGAAKIPNSAIEVLATKAFMSTRKEMFRTELVAALHILDGGDVTPAEFKGSWAGALGQPQFMPTSYLKYAVDFDGDGHRNIWTSVPDTLASIANYLLKKGWQRNRDWGFEVSIPEAVSCAQEGPDLAKPLWHWASLGIDRISGKGFPSGEMKAEGMMLVPAGRDGPEFIVTPNFYIIKEYNNSDLYALYIGNLADRIAYNGGAFEGRWGDVGKMLRSDVAAMQKALERQGYDVGGSDGLPGYKTRRSIGQWQAKNGMKPTCFPEATMKGKLK